jgi:hypothetical protein
MTARRRPEEQPRSVQTATPKGDSHGQRSPRRGAAPILPKRLPRIGRHHPPMGARRRPMSARNGVRPPSDNRLAAQPMSTGNGLPPDAPLSPVRSPQDPRLHRPRKRLPSPHPRRLGPPSKPELRRRRGRCPLRRSLLSRLFLHPRCSMPAISQSPTRPSPRRGRGRQQWLSLASRFLAGRPIQCDDPDTRAANQ